MNKKIIGLIVFLYLFFMGDYLVNLKRTKPTLSWFPQWVYIEHFFASFLICLAIFYFFYILWKIPKILNKEYQKVRFFLSLGISLGSYTCLSIYYDWVQFVNTQVIDQLYQIIPNLIGIVCFYYFIEYNYREMFMFNKPKDL